MLEGCLSVVLLIGVFAPFDGFQPSLLKQTAFLDEILRSGLAFFGEDVNNIEYAPEGAEKVTDCSKNFVAPDQDRNDPGNTRSVVRYAGGRCVFLFNTDMGGVV